jgi:pyruvate ferredoxin oxidoreductase alpha subunit
MPTQEQVDAFLPPFDPRQVLDPQEPVSMGAMVGPEAFTEVRYLAHVKQMQALDLIPGWAAQFREAFGRDSGGLMHGYRMEDADTVVVALGSVLGTIKDTVDGLREKGHRIGVLGITCFRPWPTEAIRKALAGAKKVIVVEKAFGVGLGGIVSANVRTSSGSPDSVFTVIAGLGGRPITRESLTRIFLEVDAGTAPALTFLDLNLAAVDRALARERETRRSGPIAEALLRDVGLVTAQLR